MTLPNDCSVMCCWGLVLCRLCPFFPRRHFFSWSFSESIWSPFLGGCIRCFDHRRLLWSAGDLGWWATSAWPGCHCCTESPADELACKCCSLAVPSKISPACSDRCMFWQHIFTPSVLGTGWLLKCGCTAAVRNVTSNSSAPGEAPFHHSSQLFSGSILFL